jgi:hypothetical protein
MCFHILIYLCAHAYTYAYIYLNEFMNHCNVGMQTVWSRRNEFQITESVQYYFNKIDIIKMPNYLPDKVIKY